MDSTSRKISNKILITNILKDGLSEEILPIIADMLQMDKNEETDTLIFLLETMDLITPAIKILSLEYKINALKEYLNLSLENYTNAYENLIYITQPRTFYKPLTQEDALKQVFQLSHIQYPSVGETEPLIEKIKFFDEEDLQWKECVRRYLINESGRVLQFISEDIEICETQDPPPSSIDFDYSWIGYQFFEKIVSEEELLNI